MSGKSITNYFGGLTKEEPISCVESDLLLKNTCVLEAVSPFFGYYSYIKESIKPHIIYLVTDEYISLEILTRITLKIQQKVKFPINAITGTIFHHNQTCQIIRIRDIPKYNQIAILQEMYLEHGIVFKKKSKPFQNEMAMINYHKFFDLVPIAEGVYLEYDRPNFGYFAVSDRIEWSEFRNLTTEVKYDTELLYFDAATAFIFKNRGITDLIRIYRENLTAERLIAIKNKYLKIMG